MESVLSAGDINSNPGRTVFACKSLSLSLAVTFAGAPGYPHAIGQPLQSYLLGTKSPVQHQKEKLGDLKKVSI